MARGMAHGVHAATRLRAIDSDASDAIAAERRRCVASLRRLGLVGEPPEHEAVELRQLIGSLAERHGLERRWAVAGPAVNPETGGSAYCVLYRISDTDYAAFWPSMFGRMSSEEAANHLELELERLAATVRTHPDAWDLAPRAGARV